MDGLARLLAEAGTGLTSVATSGVGASPLPVLVDCWAEWCGPCHMVSPLVEQAAVDRALAG